MWGKTCVGIRFWSIKRMGTWGRSNQRWRQAESSGSAESVVSRCLDLRTAENSPLRISVCDWSLLKKKKVLKYPFLVFGHKLACTPFFFLEYIFSLAISSVQSLSHVRLFVTSWIAAHQASLSITNSRSSLRLTSIESVMPSSHLILCHPLLLLPLIPPSIRVFSNESTLRMRWPKYWSFSFSISASKEHPGLISFRMD